MRIDIDTTNVATQPQFSHDRPGKPIALKRATIARLNDACETVSSEAVANVRITEHHGGINSYDFNVSSSYRAAAVLIQTHARAYRDCVSGQKKKKGFCLSRQGKVSLGVPGTLASGNPFVRSSNGK